MSAINPPVNFDQETIPVNSIYGFTDPMYMDENAKVYILNATTTNAGVVTNLSQSFAGTKTFTSRPVCSAIYSGSANELVSKSYVDSLVERGVTWLKPVIAFYDFELGAPNPLASGDRYVCLSTYNDFDVNYIYEWDGSQWTEIVPSDGNASYVTSETSLYANQCILFRVDQSSSSWIQMGTNLSYGSIDGAPDFTSTETNTKLNYTEDSASTSTGALQVSGGVGIVGNIYMGGDIAGKDARFDKITLIGASNNIVMNQGGTALDGIIAVDSSGIVNITSHMEAVKVLPALAAPTIIMASNNQIGLFPSASISVDVNGVLTVDNEIALDGMQTIFAKGIKSNYISKVNYTADSTDATTGALVVSGGVGIGGNLNVGTSLNLSNVLATHTILSTIDSGSVSTGSLVLYGGMAVQKQLKVNGIGRFYSQVNMTGTTSTHTISSTVVSVSTATGALVIAGGIGVGDGIQCQTLTTRGANGITLYYGASTSTITNDINGQLLLRSAGSQKVNVNGLLSTEPVRIITSGNYSYYADLSVDGSGNLTIAPNGTTITSSKTLSLSGTANTHTISSTNDSATTTSGALVVAGGVGIGKTLRVDSIKQSGGITTVETIAVSGGAIGNVSYFKFWSTIVGVACMQVSPHTNSGGSTTDTISTGTGVIPAALRPTINQRVSCLLLAAGVYVNGWVVIQTDGRIVFTHPESFEASETNGWSGVIVQYSLL
jgi:hypothetical protein